MTTVIDMLEYLETYYPDYTFGVVYHPGCKKGKYVAAIQKNPIKVTESESSFSIKIDRKVLDVQSHGNTPLEAMQNLIKEINHAKK